MRNDKSIYSQQKYNNRRRVSGIRRQTIGRCSPSPSGVRSLSECLLVDDNPCPVGFELADRPSPLDLPPRMNL